MSSTKIPLWLDCDPGHDDAFAILLAAHHPNLNLLGISTVHGNASVSKTTTNALSILTAMSSTIPVFPGTSKPFCRPQVHAPEIHGESGLDGTLLLPTPARRPLHCNAITEMYHSLISTSPQTAWLVATGTLTNIALLFATFPDVVSHIAGLSIMGGAVGEYTDVYMGPEYQDDKGTVHKRIGNYSSFAEFNIWCDPESARTVFTNQELAEKTVLATLDLTHQVCATEEVRRMLLGGEPKTRLRVMFYELLMFFAKTYEQTFAMKDPPLHDPLAVAVVLTAVEGFRGLFDDEKRERWNVDIVTHGEQVGRTVLTPTEKGVFVPRTVDLKKFWELIEMCMAKADKLTGYMKLEISD